MDFSFEAETCNVGTSHPAPAASCSVRPEAYKVIKKIAGDERGVLLGIPPRSPFALNQRVTSQQPTETACHLHRHNRRRRPKRNLFARGRPIPQRLHTATCLDAPRGFHRDKYFSFPATGETVKKCFVSLSCRLADSLNSLSGRNLQTFPYLRPKTVRKLTHCESNGLPIRPSDHRPRCRPRR